MRAPPPRKPAPRPADFNGGLGCELSHDSELLEKRRQHILPAVIVPLENGIVDFRSSEGTIRVDRSSFLLVPARTEFRFAVVSAAPRVLTMLVGDRAIADAEAEYREHILPDIFRSVLSTVRLLPRTRWFDELSHRHYFERGISLRHSTSAARFLETEITKELYFLGKEQIEERSRVSVIHEGSETVKRACARIEENLFRPLRIRDLATSCHVSESTLLRAFRREVGMAPAVYASGRRLDEALLLLQSGRYSVGEVSARVGYENFPAFSSAFRRRFGFSPSRVNLMQPADLTPSGAERRRRHKL